MLIQMLPDQISKQWDVIWPAIEVSLPHTGVKDASSSSNILESMLRNMMQCWVYEGEGGEKVLLVTTAFVSDVGTRSRNLLIYSIYSYTKITDEIVGIGMKTLKGFASKNKCHNIIAYTNYQRIIDMFSVNGGKVDSVLLRVEVNGEFESIHKS